METVYLELVYVGLLGVCTMLLGIMVIKYCAETRRSKEACETIIKEMESKERDRQNELEH